MNTKSIYDSLPDNLKSILQKSGINDLYPPQAEAIKKGVLLEKNFILSMPTASGKTLVAELVMLKTIFENKGNCLYIVPLRALASEKYDDFKEKYSYMGIKVGIATGDFDYIDSNLAKYNILIATAEKVDSILRQKPSWLCENLACVVADEIHYIGDPKRGPTLETIITRLMSINSRVKILGLSATIANANQIAGWLNAELVTSQWRPVILKEGVYCDGEIKFSDGTSKQVELDKTNEDIAALAIDSVQDKGQVLVFLNTRKSAQAEARRIAKELYPSLTAEERKALNELSLEVDKNSTESTKISKQLSECIKNGVAFHHAGLHHEHRKLIESNFCKTIIKVICATPTLAVGVNLPSRRTIIRGLYRYESGAGMMPVRVLEYKQMSGRAGRPKYDKYGEAILVARTKKEQGELFNDFIFADTEPIHSYLGNENALRVHLLASVVTGFITSLNGAYDFINRTFFSYREKAYSLAEIIITIFDFLEKEGMLKRKDDKLLPTAFGTRISRLYIDPLSAVLIRDCLKDKNVLENRLTSLFLISSIPDMSLLALNRKDIETIVPFTDMHKGEFELPVWLNDDYHSYLAKIKTAWMLLRWMEEEQEEIICDSFGVGPGDIHRFVETADWLLYSTIELAKLFNIHSLKKLHDLRTQLTYGVKPELVELVNLKGIGRIRARSLFNHGYKSLSDITKASAESLQKIPHIGKEIAVSIKKQIEETKSVSLP